MPRLCTVCHDHDNWGGFGSWSTTATWNDHPYCVLSFFHYIIYQSVSSCCFFYECIFQISACFFNKKVKILESYNHQAYDFIETKIIFRFIQVASRKHGPVLEIAVFSWLPCGLHWYPLGRGAISELNCAWFSLPVFRIWGWRRRACSGLVGKLWHGMLKTTAVQNWLLY